MRHAVHLALALWLALAAGGAASAQSPTTGGIVVAEPWARATPQGATTGAVYMILMNKGASADRLIGAATPLAEKVEFHEETEKNGISHMRELPSVNLSPGAKLVFKPGEMHMMLVGLRQPLVQGQTFKLTLQFQTASNVELTVPIQGVGAMQHDDMNSMAHGTGSMPR